MWLLGARYPQAYKLSMSSSWSPDSQWQVSLNGLLSL